MQKGSAQMHGDAKGHSFLHHFLHRAEKSLPAGHFALLLI